MQKGEVLETLQKTSRSGRGQHTGTYSEISWSAQGDSVWVASLFLNRLSL